MSAIEALGWVGFAFAVFALAFVVAAAVTGIVRAERERRRR